MRSTLLLICLLLLIGTGTTWLGSYAAPIPVTDTYSIEPEPSSVMFIENVGQFRAGARFQSQSEIGTMFLANNALWFTVLEPLNPTMMEAIQMRDEEPPLRSGVNLRLSFLGANPDPQIEPFMPLTTSVNYFQGSNPTKWYTHVPVWSGVRYRELYPRID